MARIPDQEALKQPGAALDIRVVEPPSVPLAHIKTFLDYLKSEYAYAFECAAATDDNIREVEIRWLELLQDFESHLITPYLSTAVLLSSSDDQED